MILSSDEHASGLALIALALEEDLGPSGDVTSHATIPTDLEGSAIIVARAAGVIAGLPIAEEVFRNLDPVLRYQHLVSDGVSVQPGDLLARIEGRMRSILQGERIALNFLQHLSGIATLTRRFVDAIAGCSGKILDTRKTLPGWRRLAKYAVRCGGGANHRQGLFDGILIKDNHLAALGKEAHPIAFAIASAREKFPGLEIEIEVDSLNQLDLALPCRPAIILLDNMTNEQMREAIRRRNERAPGVLLEASGGVNLQTVRGIAETGVDRISVGALTHSAGALDIALDYQGENQCARNGS